MKTEKVISNEYFYCEHLFDRSDIIEELKKNFYIYHESGKGLEIFVKEHSANEDAGTLLLSEKRN